MFLRAINKANEGGSEVWAGEAGGWEGGEETGTKIANVSFSSLILYRTTRKELLAVVRFTTPFRHFLLGRSFTIRTDHNSLTWLLHFKEPLGQIARWLEELSQ